MRQKEIIVEMQITLAEVALNIETNTRLLNKLDRTINGNGRAGLLTKVTRHGQTLKIAAWIIGLVLAAGGAALAGRLL